MGQIWKLSVALVEFLIDFLLSLYIEFHVENARESFLIKMKKDLNIFLNLFMPNGISHLYQLNISVSNLRIVV